MLAAAKTARLLRAFSLMSLLAGLPTVEAQSCPRRRLEPEAVGLISSPYQPGSTPSRPDANVVFSGEDILFQFPCDTRLCGWQEVRVTLANESGAMLASRFEPVMPGNLWKVHPEQRY